jgi:transposase
MPAPKDPEFRRRAVELARLREKPVAQIARELGIAEPGLSSDDRSDLVRLRRDNRVQAMEIEILKRASAYFARENVLPK